MNTLFQYFLRLNILTIYIIPILVIIRFLLSKFPKRITMYIWLILAIRLVFPFTISSPLSIIQGPDLIHQLPAFPSDLTNYDTTSVMQNTLETKSMDSLFKDHIGVIIWLCGIFLILLFSCYRTFHLSRQLKDSIRLHDHIYSNDHIMTPFVFGIIHPCIYIPSHMKAMDMQSVLLHEQMHIDHYDPMKRLFAFFITCIYWFNPLVWIAYHLFQQDMEMACDERVVKTLDQPQRAAYSEMLLYVSRQTKTVPQYSIPFGSYPVKQRILRVLHYKKSKLITILLLCAICVISGVILLTNKQPVLPSAAPMDQVNTDAEALYAKRSAFVGDAAAASDVIHRIWSDAGEIELYTNGEYAININLLENKEKGVLEKEAFQNARLVFALIQNVETIYLSQGDIRFSLSRDQIQSLLPDIDLNDAFQSKETFTKLYAYQLDLIFLNDLFALPNEVNEAFLEEKHFMQRGHQEILHPEYGTAFCKDVLQGRNSELRIASITTEGDYIISYHRYIDGDYYVILDTTRDGYGRKTYFWKTYSNYHPEPFDIDMLVDLESFE